MYRRKKTINTICIALSIILLLTLGTLLYFEQRKKQKDVAEQNEQYLLMEEEQKKNNADARVFECSADDTDVIYENEYIILETADLIDNVSYRDYKSNEISFDAYTKLDVNTCYILRLIVAAEIRCTKITTNINNGEIKASYPVYTAKTEMNIPVSGITSINSIKLTSDDDTQTIYLTDIKLVVDGSEDVDVNSLRAGVYLRNASETVIAATESVGTASKAMTVCGDYLYSVCEDVLTVYDISGDKITAAATLDGIGEAVDIASVNGGKGLAVSSRNNGMYLVDISNAAHPVTTAHYDTLEFATGISARENYVFVCSRYFGIELLDVSDLNNPKFITQIYSETKEYFDCTYSDGFLYVSAWGQQEVEVYDLTTYVKPRMIKTIKVDGNPGGIVAEGGHLFVATGYHSQDKSDEVISVGFGMGNGLEIYDISDPSSPKWLSSNKIDGRYKYSGNDFWKVKVSGDTAVLASTYNGAYIFDISNPSAPQRIDHVTIRIEQSSSHYKNYAGSNYVFSWDTGEYAQAPIVSLALADNAVFLGDPDTGIYRYELEGLSGESNNSGSEVRINVGDQESSVKVPGYSAETYSCSESVYAAESAGGKIFAATSNGIVILDENLKELSLKSTNEAVMDLIISDDGNWLFAAESEAGVAVYRINGSTLTEVGRCVLDNYTFTATSLTLSSDNTTLIVQAGFTRVVFVDVREKANPVLKSYSTGGTMYYRNFASNTLATGSIIGYDRSKYYIFSASNGDVDVTTLTNSFSGERDGIAVSGNEVIAIKGKGYVHFNPLTATSDELNSIKVHTVSDITLHGKVNCTDDGTLMVVSDCITATVTIVNVKDLDSPKLIYQFGVDGNPDVASFYDDCILIPLRHGGLLKLEAE